MDNVDIIAEFDNNDSDNNGLLWFLCKLWY